MTDERVPERRQYESPPVVEAVARVAWNNPIPWTLTTPGGLWALLKRDYPEELRTRNLAQANLQQQVLDAPGPQGTNFQVTQGPQELIFSSDNGSRLAIIGPSSVAVHGLQPYEGWESIKDRLLKVLARISSEIPGEGLGYVQASIRYINRLDVEGPDVDFSTYLTVGLPVAPGFPREQMGFVNRVELGYPDGQSRLAFTWASVQAAEGRSACVLDLELVHSPSGLLSLEDASRELDALKVKETAAFEGLLTEAARELFVESGR